MSAPLRVFTIRLPSVLVESLGSAGTALQSRVEEFCKQHSNLLRHLAPTAPTSSGQRSAGGAQTAEGRATATSATHGRTCCVPVFGPDEEIIDPQATWTPSDVLTMDELQSSRKSLN